MNIPYKSPINFKAWQEEIHNEVKKLRTEFSVYGIILHPETISEIMNWKLENEPSMGRFSSQEYFGMYKMTGNIDLKRYEYRLEVGWINSS